MTTEREQFEAWAKSRCLDPSPAEAGWCNTRAFKHDAIELMWVGFQAGRASAVPQWQPIETAPKDGTTVLLFEHYEDEPFIGQWNNFKSRWVASTAHYDTDGDARVVDRVYSDGVTHWMPLPAAPKETT